MENNPVYKDYTIDQFTPQDLEQLSPVDIEEYLEYLKVYQNPEEKQITNTEKGLARKMSALRSFYGYYFKHQIIEKNPTLFVDIFLFMISFSLSCLIWFHKIKRLVLFYLWSYYNILKDRQQWYLWMAIAEPTTGSKQDHSGVVVKKNANLLEKSVFVV